MFIPSLQNLCSEAICYSFKGKKIAEDKELEKLVPKEIFENLVKYQEKYFRKTDLFIKCASDWFSTVLLAEVSIDDTTIEDLYGIIFTVTGVQATYLMLGSENLEKSKNLAACGFKSGSYNSLVFA